MAQETDQLGSLLVGGCRQLATFELDHGPLAKPATSEEMQHLFAHLEGELLKSGFLYPPDKAEAMMRNIRAMLTRGEFTDQEVRTLRGMIVALTRGKHRKVDATK